MTKAVMATLVLARFSILIGSERSCCSLLRDRPGCLSGGRRARDGIPPGMKAVVARLVPIRDSSPAGGGRSKPYLSLPRSLSACLPDEVPLPARDSARAMTKGLRTSLVPTRDSIGGGGRSKPYLSVLRSLSGRPKALRASRVLARDSIPAGGGGRSGPYLCLPCRLSSLSDGLSFN